MEKEVKKMSMKLSFAGEGRLSFSLDTRRLVALLERAFYRLEMKSTAFFTAVHDLFHLLMPDWYYWLFYRPTLFRLFDREDCEQSERLKRRNRRNAIVYSEELRVRFLGLAERHAQVSTDAFRSTSPRHQDRGSGDAVSNHDNLRRNLSIAVVAAVSATLT